MMTNDEVEQAIDNGTWLVRKNVLVRAFGIANDDNGEYTVNVSPGWPWVLVSELRIATPNDMLKYGE